MVIFPEKDIVIRCTVIAGRLFVAATVFLVGCGDTAEHLEHPGREAADSVREHPAAVPPDVVAVATHGPHRAIIVEQGFEAITHEVWLEWLHEPTAPDDTRSVSVTTPVRELNAGLWHVAELHFAAPDRLQLTVRFRHLERLHPITITFLAPGEYRFDGDLSVRADEL